MSIKQNANTLIDNSGNINYNNIGLKPATIIEHVVDAGGIHTYYTADYNSTTKTLTFRKILDS